MGQGPAPHIDACCDREVLFSGFFDSGGCYGADVGSVAFVRANVAVLGTDAGILGTA